MSGGGCLIVPASDVATVWVLAWSRRRRFSSPSWARRAGWFRCCSNATLLVAENAALDRRRRACPRGEAIRPDRRALARPFPPIRRPDRLCVDAPHIGDDRFIEGVWSGVLDAQRVGAVRRRGRPGGFRGPPTRTSARPPTTRPRSASPTAALLRGGSWCCPVRRLGGCGRARAHRPSMTTFMAPTVSERSMAASQVEGLLSLRLLVHAVVVVPSRPRSGLFGAGTTGWCGVPRIDRGRVHGVLAAGVGGASGTVGRARPGRSLDIDADGVAWCHVPGFAWRRVLA